MVDRGLCLTNPRQWRDDCQKYIPKVYNYICSSTEEKDLSVVTNPQLTELKSLLDFADTDCKNDGTKDGVVNDISFLLHLLRQYCLIPDSILRSDEGDWRNAQLYAATICSVLMNVEAIYEMSHESKNGIIPGSIFFDFSDAFRNCTLALRVMQKLESLATSIDYMQFAKAEITLEFGLISGVLSEVWRWFGLSLNGNACFQSATYLFLCAYNIGALDCKGSYDRAKSAVEAACSNLVLIGEYEMAIALCCRLLYGIPNVPMNPAISICDEFSPVLFGKLNGNYNIEMTFARALSKLANGLERVARARHKPFALLESTDNANPVFRSKYLGEYARLAELLRSIALSVMRSIIGCDLREIAQAATYDCVRVLLTCYESSVNVRLYEGQNSHPYLCEAREIAKSMNGMGSPHEVVLQLRVLLTYLGTFRWDGEWYGCGTLKELEDALVDFQHILQMYNSLKDSPSQESRIATRELERDYDIDFLCTCSSLLTMIKDKTVDDKAVRACHDAVLCLVGIATDAARFRRSCECVFPDERDYLSGVAVPRGQVYALLAQYTTMKVWKSNNDDSQFVEGLERIQARCLMYEIGVRSSISSIDVGISYYTTLTTANYLFDLINLSDSKSHSSVGGGLAESVGSEATKNCLTVMHASYMNDPNEGTSLLEHLGCLELWPLNSISVDVRERISRGGFTFIKSFTTMVDQLHMWSMYGSDNSAEGDCDGCCVRFSRDMFTKKEGFALGYDGIEGNVYAPVIAKNGQYTGDIDGNNLYRVVYIDNDGKVIGDYEPNNVLAACCLRNIKSGFELINQNMRQSLYIDEKNLREALIRLLTPIAFLVKDANYSREEEIRLLFYRPLGMVEDSDICVIDASPVYRSKLCIKPFKQVGIDEIILGPKFSKPQEVVPYLTFKLSKMKKVAAGYGIQMEGRVTQSKIDYR